MVKDCKAMRIKRSSTYKYCTNQFVSRGHYEVFRFKDKKEETQYFIIEFLIK